MNYVRGILIIVTMLFVAPFSAGCGATGNSALADMTAVLPQDIDSLFIISSDILEAVPELNEMWQSLTEQTLPVGASPASLGMATLGGNLVGLLYTFPGDFPAYAGNTTETLDISGLTVTRTDNFWDAFFLGDIMVVGVKDFTGQIIANYQDGTSSLHDTYSSMSESLPEGLFTAVRTNTSIGGKAATLGVTLNYAEKSEGAMTVTGIFQVPGGPSSTALADYLERCGITDARITQADSVFKVAGRLDPQNFTGLMNMLTGGW